MMEEKEFEKQAHNAVVAAVLSLTSALLVLMAFCMHRLLGYHAALHGQQASIELAEIKQIGP
jgi:hypothetical protein